MLFDWRNVRCMVKKRTTRLISKKNNKSVESINNYKERYHVIYNKSLMPLLGFVCGIFPLIYFMNKHDKNAIQIPKSLGEETHDRDKHI